LPSVAEFCERLRDNAHEMVMGSAELARVVATHTDVSARCLHRSTAGLESEAVFKDGQNPRLVLTSPPYPGVHVLYHRWQIDGRKETAAPFIIANKLDGAGSSYYTMGD